MPYQSAPDLEQIKDEFSRAQQRLYYLTVKHTTPQKRIKYEKES